MATGKQFTELLKHEGFKLWKYSYTIHTCYGGSYNLIVKGYLWSKSKPEYFHVLGSKDNRDKTLSYILEVEYIGQDLSQTITKA